MPSIPSDAWPRGTRETAHFKQVAQHKHYYGVVGTVTFIQRHTRHNGGANLQPRKRMTAYTHDSLHAPIMVNTTAGQVEIGNTVTLSCCSLWAIFMRINNL